MIDDSPIFESDRRLFLKLIGVLGISAAAGPAVASAASGSLDEYHQTLRDDLTASSREQRQLPSGTYVYGTTEREVRKAFSLSESRETQISVDTDAVPITMGERLHIPTSAENPSKYAYRSEIPDHSFSEGDLLLAVAYVRSDSDDAEATAAFGYRTADSGVSENFVQRGAYIDPSGKWMRYYFPIKVGAKPDADAVPTLEFWTGYAEQTLDFGGIALFDYSDADISLEGLPPYDYRGRAEDAEWRDTAHERIEEVRKRDIEVEVLNPGGQPMHGATVEVEMTEHEFDFGSAVSVEHITGEDEDDEIYRETLLENFNKATIENGLKYPAWEGDWNIDKDATRATLDWLNEHDIPVRGHYLLWEQLGSSSGGGMSLDPDLSPAAIEERVTEKIQNHANEFEAEVTEWDMHNHPIWQHNFRAMDALGWDAIEKWWLTANEATDHELYANEMGVVGGSWQRSQYYDYISRLIENDYPIDGIGFMGHHQQKWNQILDVEDIISGFEQFSGFVPSILVTEFDIQIFDRRNAQEVAVQRDYLRDFLTVAFSEAAVEGVISWGFWAEDHWRPTGAYYDSDWSLRAHGEKFRELVFEEWWTEETGETNNDGVYATSVFKGTHRVTAEKGSLSGETTVTFDDENGSVTVELSPPTGNRTG
jgi:GH35 family endo-1,4-beta-xylanase